MDILRSMEKLERKALARMDVIDGRVRAASWEVLLLRVYLGETTQLPGPALSLTGLESQLY